MDADWLSAGVDYCMLHGGIRNEDEHRCDMAWHDIDHSSEIPEEELDDGEPRPCVLRSLYYQEDE